MRPWDSGGDTDGRQRSLLQGAPASCSSRSLVFHSSRTEVCTGLHKVPRTARERLCTLCSKALSCLVLAWELRPSAQPALKSVLSAFPFALFSLLFFFLSEYKEGWWQEGGPGACGSPRVLPSPLGPALTLDPSTKPQCASRIPPALRHVLGLGGCPPGCSGLNYQTSDHL